MPVFLIYLLFFLSLAAVIKGGDWLVDSAVWFATILGISQVIVGATIVSMGTTLPETMISSFAALTANGEIVMGTAIGSILCNTGIILGLNNVVRPTAIQDKDTFLKVGTMVGLLVLIYILSLNGMIGGFDTLVLLFLFFAYIGSNIWAGAHQPNQNARPEFTAKDILRQIGRFVCGLILVVAGARLLLDTGTTIARMLNIPEAIIAITLFAIGSSLPELVTSITAALKGHNQLFLGNVLGANTLNILMVIGVSSAVGAFPVTNQVLRLDIPAALVLMGIIVVPSFITKKISRLQGFLTFLVYVAYISYLIMIR